MKYGYIRGVKLPVSRLIQGTRLLPSDPSALFDSAFIAGCTAFESAPVYDEGSAEWALGRWVESHGLRSQIVLITKGCHPIVTSNWKEWVPRVTPEALHEDIKGSLDRLETSYIDLFLLHRDDLRVPVGEILEALNEEVAAGRIRSFGASNWSHERMQQANAYATRHGLISFAAGSLGFSLVKQRETWPGCLDLRQPDNQTTFDWFEERGLPFLAWSPLAGGFLTGRYTKENLSSLADEVVRFYASEQNIRRLERLRILAAIRGTTMARIALAYVFSFPLDMYAVVGCQTDTEFYEMMEALDLTLTTTDRLFLQG